MGPKGTRLNDTICIPLPECFHVRCFQDLQTTQHWPTFPSVGPKVKWHKRFHPSEVACPRGWEESEKKPFPNLCHLTLTSCQKSSRAKACFGFLWPQPFLPRHKHMQLLLLVRIHRKNKDLKEVLIWREDADDNWWGLPWGESVNTIRANRIPPPPRTGLGEQKSGAKSKHTTASCWDAVSQWSVVCGRGEALL